ncbi:two-partner secretion domain-containing protein, partial [Bergeriella denitrificans]
MNKTRYKVIFNKKRGCMVAVAEHTLREGKSAQDGSGACITPSENAPASAVCSGKIGLLSFSLMMCLGLALIVPAHASEIRPDRSAPGNQQPTILQTANGLPQVNIQTPSAAGVSLNQYRQFDVDTKGAVLNNSRSGVQTQLGGRIQGNPWLATGEARIIVNQINSTNPSLLNGYIEVGGRRAEVIMANPAGIRVNGAGFINAAGVTLTTGRPVLDNGALTGYQVREGEIAVNGGGLDTSTADYTRILSRAAQINAGIWGKDIQVAAGNNNVSANGKVHAVSNGQTPPAVAIDTGTLGGMYAGKITLISSDRGAAVRNAGQIFAAAGGVTLSADGTVGNSGSMVASDSAQSGADIAAVSVKATDLSNSGTLSSQGKAAIATHNLDNSGFIGSSDELAVVNQSALSNGGQINAARLDIQTGSLNNSGRIAQTGPQALALSAGSLDNRGSGYIGAPKADTTTGSPPVSATDKTAAAPTTAAGSGSVAAPSATAAHSPTLADGNITVTDSLANSGEITANNGTDLSTRNGLGNHAELSLNTLTVSGALFDNQSGSISAKQANITATAFDNRSGSLVASESIRIRNQSVDNRNGSLQSGGVLMVDTVSFDNSDGQTAALDTDITAKHLNNQKGSLDSGRLNIHAARLDNQSGFIRSDNETALQISDGLNNNGGEITSAQNVHITDSGQNTLSIQNSSGSILAGQDAAIQAKALEADGTLAAGRDLGISLQDDFTTAHNIEAGRALSISTQGRLQNAHLLQGGAAVTLNTADIDNTADGKIQSGSDTRLSASNITNRGLINSNGLTRIEGKDTVENIGSGKIYGDHVAFAAGKLLNREETAGGETRAAVIAARERLDIGAQDITNQESALLSSEGRLKIGGSLDAGHQTKGRAQTLINSSARIEAQGDGAIAVDDLQNVNKHFVAEEYLAESKQVMTFTRPDEAEPFFTNLVDGTFRWEKHDMNFDFYDGTNIAYKEGNVLGVKLEEYTESVYKQRVTENQPGEISIGGNLNVDADKITNRDSMILSGGAMATSSPIENEATPAPVKLARKGNLYTLFHQNSIKRSDPTAINTVITKQGVFEPATATVEEYSQAVLPVTNKQIEIQPVADLNIESVQNAIRHLPLPATLPISALYAVNPAHPQFLIETDPAFTDYRQWLGSDYMLKAFKQDPANMHKRLGDGYYEQKLVNEQIARLTGHRRLDGYQNDEDQFKALMDNGITYARTFNLTPGIALTAEQVARLTSDIVWLEPQSYTLIDGSRVTVLAPKVYVVARKGDVNSAGGLISADQIRLQSDGNLSNSGTIAGRSIVDLGAGNISNSGLIQGGQVRVQADERLEVIGGSIAADNALIARAKDIRIESTTATSGDKQNGSTVIDRVAGLYVNHISDGLMLVEAGKIDFVGATVRNEAAKGQTQIRAAGDLNLSTVQTENHESYGALSDKNHRHVHTSAETGTQIQTAGDIVLSGNNINARQADINSDSGDVVLDAKNNLNITEGRKTLDLDASAYSKQKKLTSSSSQLAQYRRNDDEAVSGSITGKRVFLNSGGDTLIRGSDIVSDNLTQITAGGNIAIEAAQSRYDGSEFHQSKKSGLMGSGGIGFTVGSKKDGTATRSQTTAHSGSTVGSLSGDTLIQAGGDYRQTGSTVSSPKGNVLIHARNIDIEAAQDTYATDYKHTIEQKGLTVAVNVPVVQAVQGAVAAAKTVGKSKNARVNAMAAANAAQSVRAADQALGQAAQNPQAAAQEVSVSITYGQQKSTDQSHITGTSALASQTIGGGKVSLIADNEAGNARIRIAGSDVAGKSGTLLSADSIALQSAEQTHSERSSNQSSGWNAGVAVSYGQNGFAFGITAGGNYGKGYGNGDDLTHRHSHIGDANSQTLIQSSGDTLIKGAQVKGQSIGLTAANLTIESVQDTAAYQSKQQNISGQVTVGYGVSGSASYSQSKTNADHASVTEQSGLFAGDGGFNVNIRNHTELKGGIIT